MAAFLRFPLAVGDACGDVVHADIGMFFEFGGWEGQLKVPFCVRHHGIGACCRCVRGIPALDSAGDFRVRKGYAREAFHVALDVYRIASIYGIFRSLHRNFEFRAFVFRHGDVLRRVSVSQAEIAVQGGLGYHERTGETAISVGAHLLGGKLLPVGIIERDLAFHSCPRAKGVLGCPPAISFVIDPLPRSVNLPVGHEGIFFIIGLAMVHAVVINRGHFACRVILVNHLVVQVVIFLLRANDIPILVGLQRID